MTRASFSVSICAALVALGTLVACGDDVDGPADAGRRDSGESSDAGEDAGAIDADVAIDAGPGPARLRFAHLMPGAPSIHICLNAFGVSSALLITQSAPTGVPYRGISSYSASLRPLPILHGIRVYDAADITGGACPLPGAATPVPLIDEEVDWGATFTGGSFYTIAAVGLPGGEDASELPHLLILEDDLSPPAEGQARVRLVHTIPNLPASVPSVDVCFDPDGPGDIEPVELFDEVSFEDATDYLERAPITLGVVSMHVHNPEGAPIPDCLAVRPPGGTMLLQAPVPFPVPSGPGIPPNLVDTFDADTIDSAFIVGDATMSPVATTPCTTDAMCADAMPEGQTCNTLVGVCTHPLGPTLIPWQDNLGLP